MPYPIKDVTEYLLWLDALHEGDGISNMKLQKLAYYSQGVHLAVFDAPLFEERIEAWEHGPVIPPLYGACKKFGRSPIESNDEFDREILPVETRELLDEVFNVYGRFSAWILREMTHEEAPWLDNQETRGVIHHDALRTYFKTQLNSV